jgi:hypothetical protein
MQRTYVVCVSWQDKHERTGQQQIEIVAIDQWQAICRAIGIIKEDKVKISCKIIGEHSTSFTFPSSEIIAPLQTSKPNTGLPVARIARKLTI